jgi:hypothetical protein
MIPTIRLWKGFALLVTMPILAGCSSPRGDPPLTPTEERLYKIGKAYIQATTRLKRAPRNFAEIKANLAGEVSDDWMRSANDGEPFVVLWGVDYNRLPPGRDDPFTVGAYEKNGVGGQRYVLHFPIGVVLLTDEAFRKAIFPPGHKPPN